jgi:HAD superfamily hydrolase (TIGR01509 family)
MINVKVILFDLDGVVIDSEPVHAKAQKIVLENFNIPYTETIFNDYKGRTDKVFFDHVSDTLDPLKRPSDLLQNSKKMAFEKIIKELKLIDGFLLFLDKVKSKGIRTALVSSTSLYSLRLVDDLYHLSELFDLVITEVDTPLHKPYADPYLKALEKLPAEKQHTIVIEDSPTGIVSAKKAGLFVYGLTSSFHRHLLKEAGADDIIDSYNDLVKKIDF